MTLDDMLTNCTFSAYISKSTTSQVQNEFGFLGGIGLIIVSVLIFFAGYVIVKSLSKNNQRSSNIRKYKRAASESAGLERAMLEIRMNPLAVNSLVRVGDGTGLALPLMQTLPTLVDNYYGGLLLDDKRKNRYQEIGQEIYDKNMLEIIIARFSGVSLGIILHKAMTNRSSKINMNELMMSLNNESEYYRFHDDILRAVKMTVKFVSNASSKPSFDSNELRRLSALLLGVSEKNDFNVYYRCTILSSAILSAYGIVDISSCERGLVKAGIIK